LKSFLKGKGVHVDDCFDAETLMERAEATQAQWAVTEVPAAVPAPAPAPAPAPIPPAGAPASAATSGSSPTPEDVAAAWSRLCAAWPGEDPLESGPEDADKCVIMLHGFGDAGGKYLSDPLAVLLRIKGLRLLLPQAPKETLQGQSLQSWFLPTNGQWVIDDKVAEPIVAYLHAMVRRELARGVPANRIVLGGFAQGASCAIRAALSFPDAPLGGAVVLSSFFGAASATVAPANRGLKVLVCHGKDDDIVPFSEGERASGALRSLLAGSDAVTFKAYDMKHGLSTDEIADVFEFLEKRMEAEDAPEEPLAFDPAGVAEPSPPPDPFLPATSAKAVPEFSPAMDDSIVLELLNDPDITEAAKDPECMAVIQDAIMDPANLDKHRSNPRVVTLVDKILSKFSTSIAD